MLHIVEKLKQHAAGKSQQTITCITDSQQEERISYTDLYTEARYILHNLQQAGLREGDEMVFQFRSDLKFIKTFWACLLGKIIPVPVTFNTTIAGVNKVTAIWSVLNNPYVITDYSEYEETTKAFASESLSWGVVLNKVLFFDELTRRVQLAEISTINNDDIAFLQFSSGSTGNPKGVVNTHGAVAVNLSDMAVQLGLTAKDSFLGWMPLTHDFGILLFHLLPVYKDLSQYLMPPIYFITHPASWIEKMAANRITVSGAPNFGYKYVLENTKLHSLPTQGLSSVRFLISGAEPISPVICERFIHYLQPFGLAKGVIHPGYGLAEATLMVTFVTESREIRSFIIDRSKQNIGARVAFVEKDHPDAVSFVDVGSSMSTAVKIVDERGSIVPDDHIGVIHIKGPSVTKAYYNLPEETAKIIDSEGWLNTGDAGFIHEGRLVITGRVKEMIIVHGQNYYPHDLDRVMEELEWTKTRQVVSAGIYNEELCCDEIFFFIVFDGEIESFVPLVNSTRRLIRTRLGLEVGRVIPVKQIPKTTSGKIQRYKLIQDYRQGLFDDVLKKLSDVLKNISTGVFSSNETQLEKDIATVCAELLGLKRVSLQDNFFDLGYTSLTINTFKEQLESRLGISVEKMLFYRYPTVKSLAAFIYFSRHPEEAEPANNRKEIYDNARKKLLAHIRQLRSS